MAISQRIQRTMRGRPRVAVAAGLGEVASAGDAEARGQRLQQDRHQVGDHDDAEQRVAEARAAGEVGGPVARVHVADRDQVARAGEGEQLAPEAGAVRDRHRAVDFGETRQPIRASPAPGADGSPTAGVEAEVSFFVSGNIFDYSKFKLRALESQASF